MNKMTEPKNLKKKICLLGQFGVGKTSLIQRYVYNRFEEKYLTTIGVCVSQKLLPPILKAGKQDLVQYCFLIWDIGAIQKFDAMVKSYYHGAAGALAVADLTRPESIEELKRNSDQFRMINSSAKFIIIGNKIDLTPASDAFQIKYQELAKEYATDFLFTSAKTGENVEEAFIKLAEILDD
jgi:small GTP-binding protein